MLFKEWKDFVVYPCDSTRIKSRAERLNTADAFRAGSDGQYPAQMFETPSPERRAVITQQYVLRGDDVFECMEIGDYGFVIIWTRDKVWFIKKEGTNGMIEKLTCLPRHPNYEDAS